MASDSEETSNRRPVRNVEMPARYSDYDLSGRLQSNDDECPTSSVGDSAIGSVTTPKQRLGVTFGALGNEKERTENEMKLSQSLLKSKTNYKNLKHSPNK